MERLTQTRPDNCWQTCVAMLLERAVDELPAQHEFSERESYAKALRVFLDKHHGLTYVEVTEDKFSPEMVRNLLHIVIGDTVRTSPEHDAWHAVVGAAGVPQWDVHPSRAGLLKVRAWGILVPTPSEWRKSWAGEACACALCRTV